MPNYEIATLIFFFGSLEVQYLTNFSSSWGRILAILHWILISKKSIVASFWNLLGSGDIESESEGPPKNLNFICRTKVVLDFPSNIGKAIDLTKLSRYWRYWRYESLRVTIFFTKPIIILETTQIREFSLYIARLLERLIIFMLTYTHF